MRSSRFRVRTKSKDFGRTDRIELRGRLIEDEHLGLEGEAAAIASRCFCPPDSSWGCFFSSPASPTACKASCTRARISSGRTQTFQGKGNFMFDRRGGELCLWVLKHHAHCAGQYTTGCSTVFRPPTRTAPEQTPKNWIQSRLRRGTTWSCRAGCSHKREAFPRFNREEGLAGPEQTRREAEREPLDTNDRFGHISSSDLQLREVRGEAFANSGATEQTAFLQTPRPYRPVPISCGSI